MWLLAEWSSGQGLALGGLGALEHQEEAAQVSSSSSSSTAGDLLSVHKACLQLAGHACAARCTCTHTAHAMQSMHVQECAACCA
jgi:hypothetical protein